GKVHNFGSANFDTINAFGFVISFWWADPLGASTNDYDLYVLDPTGATIVASSTNVQNGTQDPYEEIDSASTGSRLVVFQKAGAKDVFFHISNYRGLLAVATSGETHGHSTASGGSTPSGMYGVAATPAAVTPFGGPNGPFPNPFNTSNQVETFT